MATGKTLSFPANELPAWDQVHALWQPEGQLVIQRKPATDELVR